MARLPAHDLRLRRRGALKPGFYADVVVFDPANVRDTASFDQPHRYAVGVRDVCVKGVQVLKDGAHTDARPGRVIRGPGWRPEHVALGARQRFEGACRDGRLNRQRWADWTGVVLVLTPFVFNGTAIANAAWIAVVGGVLLVILGVWNLARPTDRVGEGVKGLRGWPATSRLA